MFYKLIKPYLFSLVLIISIIAGGAVGHFYGGLTHLLKPFGDIFLNLIFTAIVPLIFFSVSSTIARSGSANKIGKIIFTMLTVFLFTGIIAAIYMIAVVKLFPPVENIHLNLPTYIPSSQPDNIINKIANIFTVSDFSKLLSHENMLALIIFSMLVGFASANLKDKNTIFITFLQAGETVFMRVFSLIMFYAPIGFFAYFATLVNELGPKLMDNYFHLTLIYYVSAILYFFIAFTLYAYLANNFRGIKSFWKNSFLPSITAIATCSSAASIPANLIACERMRIPRSIYETVIPLGAVLHKDGSVLGGVLKIAFLFSVFHLNFSGMSVLLTALGLSLLVGTVMGAIPGGGMLGELLILNWYGFPDSALIMIVAISIIIDPIATLLNVTGDNISALMVKKISPFTNEKICINN